MSETKNVPPLFERRDDVIGLLKLDNKVVVVEAQTGSGKSTAIPLFFLQYLQEIGDTETQIIVSEPKRLLATSIASYVAQLHGSSPLGEFVGYHTGEEQLFGVKTQLLFCSDGLVALKELLEKDPDRKKILLLDELEWGLPCELTVAWVRHTISERTNTKVFLMSATLDKDKLVSFFPKATSAFFEGRTYPVTDITDTLPPTESFPTPEDAIAHDALHFVGKGRSTLVFLAGVSDINSMKRKVTPLLQKQGLKAEILPVFSGMPLSEQEKIFSKTKNPKLILATNVAQSGITVPEHVAVVRSGLEWVNTYKDGVQGLQKAPIARSSAIQQAGRAGRVAPGETTWRGPMPIEKLNEFPTPAILNSPPEMIVLSLAEVGLKAHFVEFFHDPGRDRLLRAQRRLQSAGCLDQAFRITPLGKQVHRLPCDVMPAITLIEAEKRGVLPEMLVVIGCMLTPGRGVIRRTRSRDEDRHLSDVVRKHYRYGDGEALVHARLYLDCQGKRSNLPPKEFGILQQKLSITSPSYVEKAAKMIEKLSRRMGCEPATAIAPEKVEGILRSFLVAQKQNLHEVRGGACVSSAGVRRKMSDIGRLSIPEYPYLVVGEPFTLSGKTENNLLQDVIPVEASWVCEDLEEFFDDDGYGNLVFDGIIVG